jgi:4-amino-4-deoxy-L-arabinose transferase-like glycosyltransferase
LQTKAKQEALRRRLMQIGALVVAALVLRAAIVRVDRIVRWDEPDYLIAGRNLFTGRGYAVTTKPEIHYAPLFPIVTGMLYPLTGDMQLNSDITFVVLGAVTLIPFYWLANRLYDRRVALIAAALLCTFPALNASVIFWGTMLEPLYLLLLVVSWCSIWLAWERDAVGAYAASGLLLGLAYLTKPEAIVYLGVMYAFLIVGRLLRRRRRRNLLIGIAVGALTFALVISPYLLFLYRHTGRLLITGKLGVTYVAGLGAVEHDPGLYDRALSRLDESGEEIIWFSEDRFKYSIGDEILGDPRAFVRRVWKNVNALESVLFNRRVFPFYFLVMLGLAWFGSPWARARLPREAFLVSAVLPVLVFLPFHIELRYFAPMLLVLILWLAKGLDSLGSCLSSTLRQWSMFAARSSRIGQALTVVLCAALVAYFLALQPVVLRDGLAGMNPSRREAGLWLRENSSADALVMSRDPEVAFYAERSWIASPNEPYERVIDYVRMRGASYLVIDEREVTVIRPQLQMLLNENAPPAGLRHVYTAEDPRGKTIVYSVAY